MYNTSKKVFASIDDKDCEEKGQWRNGSHGRLKSVDHKIMGFSPPCTFFQTQFSYASFTHYLDICICICLKYTHGGRFKEILDLCDGFEWDGETVQKLAQT